MGVVTVETKSKPHCYYASKEVHKGECLSQLQQNKHFPPFFWRTGPLFSAECQRSAPDTVVMMSAPQVRKAKATEARK